MSLKEKILAEARKTADSEPKKADVIAKAGTDSSQKADVIAKARTDSLKAGTEYIPISDVESPRRDIVENRQERQVRTYAYPGSALAQVIPATFPRLHTAVEPYPRIERDRHGKFKPGSSGNPGGPEIGIVEYIRLMTDDGKELIDNALEAMRGWAPYRYLDENGIEHERMQAVDPKARADARAFLADRGYGRAVQIIETTQKDDAAFNTDALSVEELREWLRMSAKMEGKANLLESGDATRVTGFESQEALEGEG